MKTTLEIMREAKEAAPTLGWVSSSEKNKALTAMADARLAMTLWHTVPRQMEHVLAGVAVYLGFSVLVSKLCAAQRRQG